jgi:hypothetical protein
MVKTSDLKPLERITHAQKFLKAQRVAPSFNAEKVVRVFIQWYRPRPSELVGDHRRSQ